MSLILNSPHILLIVAALCDVSGGILIAYVVFSVHQHIAKERRIDADVLNSMRTERMYVLFGIGLIVLSFLIETWVRLVLGNAIV